MEAEVPVVGVFEEVIEGFAGERSSFATREILRVVPVRSPGRNCAFRPWNAHVVNLFPGPESALD